jgi:Macrocin-O-methyltransferase (TylF)
MLSAPGLEMRYTRAAHCERAGLKGAFVECGVWHGGSAAVMARAILDEGATGRRLHLFDSFVGIPEPDADLDGAKVVEAVGGVTHARGRLRVAIDYRDRGGPGSEATVRALLPRPATPTSTSQSTWAGFKRRSLRPPTRSGRSHFSTSTATGTRRRRPAWSTCTRASFAAVSSSSTTTVCTKVAAKRSTSFWAVAARPVLGQGRRGDPLLDQMRRRHR